MKRAYTFSAALFAASVLPFAFLTPPASVSDFELEASDILSTRKSSAVSKLRLSNLR